MNTLISIAPLLLIMLVFYLMTFRSIRRQRDQAKKIETSLKTGAKVVTIGGLHGEVVDADEKTVTLKSGTTKLVFDRKAIAKIDDESK